MPLPRRVLVVDRSRESRELLAALVERLGVEVHVAHDADSAAAAARTSPPDLVLADLDTPQRHSAAAGRAHARLSAAAAVSGAPIVILGTLPRGATPSPDAQYVAKPYQYGQLIRKIEGILERRAG